jgi:hypothetical protein
MRYYEWSNTIKPSTRPIIFVAILALAILIAARHNGVAREVAVTVGIVVVAVSVAYIIPQLISWYISIIIQHYAAAREAHFISDEILRLNAQERLLDKYDDLIHYIANLDNDHLKAVLAVPTPAEMDLMPAGGEFLILPSSGERVPMPIVRDVAERWITMTYNGRNPYHLPPLRTWSGREREFARALYLDLAKTGLVIIRDVQSDQPWKGNLTATVAPYCSPVDILRYLRLENDYSLEDNKDDSLNSG